MVLLPLAAVSAWGSVWSWRGFRAKRLPELDAPDYFDTAVSEGPSEAVAGLFWGASGPSGPLASADDYFELAGLLLFLGLLTGTIVGLVTGDLEMSGGCLALLALNALGLAVGYLFGWLDGQVEAAREVLDFLGG